MHSNIVGNIYCTLNKMNLITEMNVHFFKVMTTLPVVLHFWNSRVSSVRNYRQTDRETERQTEREIYTSIFIRWKTRLYLNSSETSLSQKEGGVNKSVMHPPTHTQNFTSFIEFYNSQNWFVLFYLIIYTHACIFFFKYICFCFFFKHLFLILF